MYCCKGWTCAAGAAAGVVTCPHPAMPVKTAANAAATVDTRNTREPKTKRCARLGAMNEFRCKTWETWTLDIGTAGFERQV